MLVLPSCSGFRLPTHVKEQYHIPNSVTVGSLKHKAIPSASRVLVQSWTLTDFLGPVGPVIGCGYFQLT